MRIVGDDNLTELAEDSGTGTTEIEFVLDHAKADAKVSVMLIDWGVRESFHSLQYLNRQSVDRSRYELIWVEFYDRLSRTLLDAVDEAETAGQPLVDKLVKLNYSRDVIFHKHRMYNLGIVLSEGEICVICDSDAIFTPNFIQSIITAFEENPQSVVHLDEVRSVSRNFYPFNYPTLNEFLNTPCLNWTGKTTKGLDQSSDMLHEANYGACMAARRDDIIRIGGSDEHLDYLGYICGPYDLTFRLVNAGLQERWLTHEYLYHSWHPGESGINIDYQGPSDGRGMSSQSLSARESGRIEPELENGAIRALRIGSRPDRTTVLALLESPDDGAWREQGQVHSDDSLPQLASRAFLRAYDTYFYRGCWYGISTGTEPFDPVKAQSGGYETCLRAQSAAELKLAIRSHLANLERERSVRQQPWNWRQFALLRLAARIVRPLVPTRILDAYRRRRTKLAVQYSIPHKRLVDDSARNDGLPLLPPAMPHRFLATSRGASATRWLSFVLASHPRVFAAHGKHCLESIMRGQIDCECRQDDTASLTLGNLMSDFYRCRSLNEVFETYGYLHPGTQACGNVHTYQLAELCRRFDPFDDLTNVRIVNVIRHPVMYIASHTAMVQSGRKLPMLREPWTQEFHQAMETHPKLRLIEHDNDGHFEAFIVSCQSVAKWAADFGDHGVPHVKMEEVTSDVDRLAWFCEYLTRLPYDREKLAAFIENGPINRHRSASAETTPHSVYGQWQPWQRSAAAVILPAELLERLQAEGYDVTMLRNGRRRPRPHRPLREEAAA